MLGDRVFFHNYRNSAEIGLGLVALARGDLEQARRLLEAVQADSANIYPYTYVQALLGLARLADVGQNAATRDRFLRKALRFAGQRSLLEEYMSVLVEVTRMDATTAPRENLIDSILEYVEAINFESGVATPVSYTHLQRVGDLYTHVESHSAQRTVVGAAFCTPACTGTRRATFARAARTRQTACA